MTPDTNIASAREIVSFWRDAGREKWFFKDPDFDTMVHQRFLATHEAAARGDLADWEDTAEGTLALLILLDQFPRNMFRGLARSFASDAQALDIAKRGLLKGFDVQTELALRGFFYLPFMHSEDLAEQERCIALYTTLGNPDNMKYAEIHADIIRRFGRFPHRNAVLGRKTTPEEQLFLDAGGFAG